MGAVAVLSASAFQKISARQANEAEKESEERDEARTAAETEVNEETEEPFINILEAESSEMTITWDTAFSESFFAGIASALNEETSALTEEGYSVAFLLYDLNTGGGISYYADEIYYSASAIKAPYVTWLVQTYPEMLMDYYSVIENTISWSSNSDYFTLINNFGKSGFNSWTAQLGSSDITLTDSSFGEITCRSFTRIWIEIYEYFMSGDETAEQFSSFFIGTENSCIYETLGAEYTVYSKAGWYSEGEGSYYTVQNDAGIVMKEDNPYILTILSDAYGELELLGDLVAAADQAHTALSDQEKVESSVHIQ